MYQEPEIKVSEIKKNPNVEYDPTGCRKLLCAVVLCAIEDYRSVLSSGLDEDKLSSRNIKNTEITVAKNHLHDFFNSDYIDEILRECGLNISSSEIMSRISNGGLN